MAGILSGMAGGAVVAITIRGIDDFSKTFQSAQTGLDKFSKAAKIGMGIATAAFAASSVAVFNFGKDSIKAAAESEAAQNRLVTIVTNLNNQTNNRIESLIAEKNALVASRQETNSLTAAEEQEYQEKLKNIDNEIVLLKARDTSSAGIKEQVKLLNDQARALQNVGVVSDDNISIVQSQLATFDMSTDAIHNLTPAILDYVVAEKGAGASTDEFRQMTNGLAQALNGNFASLTRTGFILDDATKELIRNGTESEKTAAIVDVLNSTYKDMNINAKNTTEGGLQALSNQFHQIKEDVGTALLPTLNNLVSMFSTDILPAIQPLIPLLGESLAGILESFGPVIKKIMPVFIKFADIFINRILPAIEPLIGPITDIIVVLAEMGAEIIEALLPAIEMLIPFIVDMLELWKPMIPTIMRIIEILAQFIGQLIEQLLPAIEPLMPVFAELTQIILEAGLSLLEALIPAIVSLLPLIVSIFEVLSPVLMLIGKVIGFVVQLAAAFISIAVKTITAVLVPALDVLTSVFQFIGDKVKWFIDLIMKLIDKIKELVESMKKISLGAIEKVGGAISNVVGKVTGKSSTKKVNDAIIRPDGSIIETHPKDTLVAMKNVDSSLSPLVNNTSNDYLEKLFTQLISSSTYSRFNNDKELSMPEIRINTPSVPSTNNTSASTYIIKIEGNIYGTDPEEISEAIMDKLRTKTILGNN